MEKFVQAGPVRLQYFESGSGDHVIVLVHGYSASGRIWKLTQDGWDPGRYRTIAISNRGAGDSDHSSLEADYSVEAFARDLFAAVQALGLKRFTLVGHSMGGLTVTQFALEHQDLLDALVLLNPAPLNGRTGPRPQPGTAAGTNRLTDRLAAPQEFLDLLQADVARNPPARLSAGRKAIDGSRLHARLAELKIPVLVVGGDQDTLVGVGNILRDYLELPSDGRALHIFHGVGHEPNIAVPVELAGVIDRFVAPSCRRPPSQRLTI